MDKPVLTVVDSPVYDLSKPETPSERIRRLQANAHALAHEQVLGLTTMMDQLAEMAGEIAGGGEAYPVGVREICERMAEEMGPRAATIRALADRD
ncbi:MAG TPA: hypothetical protein VGM25_13450 [Caulobacteraceae bacterium]|jgi:hypothetical protein